MKQVKIKQEEARAKKLPDWITDHFVESFRSLERLSQIVQISRGGIGMLRGVPRAIKVLANSRGNKDGLKAKVKLENAEKAAELATQEIAKDFPVLHGLAVVALWSWLENFIKGLLVLWLTHRKDSYTSPPIQKLKIRLGEYLQLSKNEQAQYIIELLEQELASPLKRGIARFESLLEPFSLSGSLPDDCRKTLFELQQMRNSVTHNNSLVDRRLKENCPWLKQRKGQPVKITQQMLRRYERASAQFLFELFHRIGSVYGVDTRSEDGITN